MQDSYEILRVYGHTVFITKGRKETRKRFSTNIMAHCVGTQFLGGVLS